MFVLSPVKRRILYVTVFELIAIAATTVLLMLLSGSDAQGSLPIAIAISAIAVAWNYSYNLLFERMEARQQREGRSLMLRVGHAFGFEFGLCVIIIPIYMVWYSVSFWKALQMEAALLLFFLVYTFIFTYIFDLIFELPNYKTQTEER